MGASESFFKKIRSISKTGITPVMEGRSNYLNPSGEVEAEVLKRMAICKGCENFVDEPISFFRIEDHLTPELSEKCCNRPDCGCALAYLLRQNIKICKKWPNG